MEGLSFDEQVRWFSNQNIIVAAHGVALTNAAFVQQGIIMMEVRECEERSDELKRRVYRTLGRCCCRLRRHFLRQEHLLLCDLLRSSQLFPPNYYPVNFFRPLIQQSGGHALEWHYGDDPVGDYMRNMKNRVKMRNLNFSPNVTEVVDLIIKFFESIQSIENYTYVSPLLSSIFTAVVISVSPPLAPIATDIIPTTVTITFAVASAT